MVTYKQYLALLVLVILFSLMAVSLTNYTVDPANIYHETSEAGSNSASVFAAKLITTDNGLLWPNDSWNTRDIKSALAKDSRINLDCAVIGSSHIMQISFFRQNNSLSNMCSSILNLGVDGGTLEDSLALVYMLISREQKPNTIVFGIAPWALNFQRDTRWERYQESYYSMWALLFPGGSVQNNAGNSEIKYIVNLVNPHYFVRSLQSSGGGGREKHTIEEAPKFDYADGFEEPVLLPDGGFIFSQDYVAEANARTIPPGGGVHYKIDKGLPYSETAISTFERLLEVLKAADIQTVILMTPYHPMVWEDKNSLTTKALLEIEPRIREIGNRFGIPVIGSYDPDRLGCSADEFYDEMHAKDTCLSKI